MDVRSLFALTLTGALAILAAACLQQPRVEDWRSLRIALSRGPCLGTCPSYVVAMDGDGSVRYCGEAFVASVGTQRRTIDPASVRNLYDKFVAARFFSLRNAYVGGITDQPTYVLSVSVDGRTKSVIDYAGEMDGLPAPIRDLENEIDRLAGTSSWIEPRQQTWSRPIAVFNCDALKREAGISAANVP